MIKSYLTHPVIRRLAALCFAIVFVFTSAAFAQAADAEVRTSFPDVPQDHWAYKQVTKLALQDIISGKTSGHFSPNEAVTRQDALIMAVSFMGLKEEALSSQLGVVLPYQLEVNEWAQPFVRMAVKQGLINIEEELSSLTEGDAIWGRRAASREWVAQIIVRAVGREDLAEQLSGEETDFKDHDEISAWALGYVQAAANLNIVSGFNDGTFRPKDTVTRAQMAVMLGNAEAQMAKKPEHVVTGMVQSIDDSTIVVADDTGEVHVFSLADEAVAFSGNEAISPEDIGEYSYVYVIHRGGTAYYAEILDDDVQLDRAEGVLFAKDADNRTILLEIDGELVPFELSPGAAITGPDGSGLSLESLVKNSVLEVWTNTQTEDPSVVRIIVKKVPVNKSAEGVVIDIDEEKLTVQEKGTDGMETFPLADDIDITYGDRTLKLDQLHAGDEIAYEVKDSTVVSIEVLEPSEPILETVSGTVVSLDAAQKVITIQTEEKELKSFFTLKDVEVILEGGESAKLADVKSGDEVDLQIDEDNAVVTIEILNRQVETRHLMNIIHYEPSLHSLWVQWNETESGTFTLTENTVIEYGGKVWKLEDAKEVLVPGRKVDMTFTDGQVIAIRVSQGYNGTIESIDTKEMKITVQSEDGKTITLDLTNSTKVYIPNQSSAKLKDLHKGDQIYVELSSDQKKADKIRVRETRMFRVISVNEKDRKLIAADANGSFVTLNIPVGADITDAAKENADFGDIETDEPILVHYRGTSIEAVYIPRAVRGKVTAVDEANSTLTVYDYNKATRKITLSKNAVITIDGDDERLKLSSIAENSRVEVVDDGSGHQFITVMTSGKKKFFKYDKNSGKVSFTKSQINEKNQFDLHPDAFIHDQFTSLNPANLLENTMFNVYFLNGKIVEMEKQ